MKILLFEEVIGVCKNSLEVGVCPKPPPPNADDADPNTELAFVGCCCCGEPKLVVPPNKEPPEVGLVTVLPPNIDPPLGADAAGNDVFVIEFAPKILELVVGIVLALCLKEN